jgi:hypothetical protein
LVRCRPLLTKNKKGTIIPSESVEWESDMADDKRTAWLQKLDEKCPYEVVLPRRQLMDDGAVVDFLLAYVGKFDLYVEDQCPAYVRYCFEEPMDAAIFRSRFAAKSERFRLAG